MCLLILWIDSDSLSPVLNCLIVVAQCMICVAEIEVGFLRYDVREMRRTFLFWEAFHESWSHFVILFEAYTLF